MNLINKNNAWYLLFLFLNLGILSIFTFKPVLYLSCQDFLNFIQQGKSSAIASLKMTFDETIFTNIKLFFSRGILLFLTFWISIYVCLLMKWKPEDRFIKRICLGIVFAITWGTLGIFLNSQTKLKAYTPIFSSAMALDAGDVFKQTILFSKFDEKFLSYLKRAEAGEVNLSILNANEANDTPTVGAFRPEYDMDIRIGNRKFDKAQMKPFLSPQMISEFIQTKEISYTLKVRKQGFYYLYLRAAGKLAPSRNDSLSLNSTIMPIPDHDSLPLIFRFEEPTGKPIIAFY